MCIGNMYAERRVLLCDGPPQRSLVFRASACTRGHLATVAHASQRGLCRVCTRHNAQHVHYVCEVRVVCTGASSASLSWGQQLGPRARRLRSRVRNVRQCRPTAESGIGYSTIRPATSLVLVSLEIERRSLVACHAEAREHHRCVFVDIGRIS